MNKTPVETLKELIMHFSDLLVRNLSAAHDEWMGGKIAKGAYHYVLHRHSVSVNVMNDPDISEEQAFLSCAPLFIDIRTSLEFSKDKDLDTKKLNELIQLFNDNGFTENHIFFDFPVKPT